MEQGIYPEVSVAVPGDLRRDVKASTPDSIDGLFQHLHSSITSGKSRDEIVQPLVAAGWSANLVSWAYSQVKAKGPNLTLTGLHGEAAYISVPIEHSAELLNAGQQAQDELILSTATWIEKGLSSQEIRDKLAEAGWSPALANWIFTLVKWEGVNLTLVFSEHQVDATKLDSTAAKALDEVKRARVERANSDIGQGILWIIGGIVATAIAYAISSEGGRYAVFYGAILFGLYKLYRGLSDRKY